MATPRVPATAALHFPDAHSAIFDYQPLAAGRGGRPPFARWVFKTKMSDIAFDCIACGACCFSRNPRYLVLLPEDAQRPLPPDSLVEDAGRRFVDFSCGHCTHLRLDSGQALCAVYEARPEACRAFRAGSFECLRAIRANGVMGEKVREVALSA